jgi:hypothetical protein
MKRITNPTLNFANLDNFIKELEDYCTPEDEPIIDLIEGIVKTSYAFDRHLHELFPESTTWSDKNGWN